MLTKITNLFKKETWKCIKEEEAKMTVGYYDSGFPMAIYPCVVIHEQSNKGNKRYFMVELEGYLKGFKYPYDYQNKKPLIAVEDIPKCENLFLKS